MDLGIDMGTEQVTFAGDFLFSSVVEGFFCIGKNPMLETFLNDRGAVMADFGYNTNIFKTGEGIVY